MFVFGKGGCGPPQPKFIQALLVEGFFVLKRQARPSLSLSAFVAQNSPLDCFVPCGAASHPAATRYQSAAPLLGSAFSFSAARSRRNDPL